MVANIASVYTIPQRLEDASICVKGLWEFCFVFIVPLMNDDLSRNVREDVRIFHVCVPDKKHQSPFIPGSLEGLPTLCADARFNNAFLLSNASFTWRNKLSRIYRES